MVLLSQAMRLPALLLALFNAIDAFSLFSLSSAPSSLSISGRSSRSPWGTPRSRCDTSRTKKDYGFSFCTIINIEDGRIGEVAALKGTRGDSTERNTLGIIIAGAPASGKGTQCEMIKDTFDVVHLSTGDMLRASVAAETAVGKLAKEYMDSGKLVPDDVIIGVVKDRLDQADCKEKGWLLDGFPRTRAQADALADAGICADCFIFLNVPDSVLVERVVGRRTDPETGKIYHMKFSPPSDAEVLARLVQRSDDTEEKVKVRLEQFHTNVDAVQGCYQDIAVEIDGTTKPAEVASAIERAIREKCGEKVSAA